MKRSDRDHFMAQLPERLRTQDTRGTQWPLYCVEEEERVYGMDRDRVEDASKDYEWIDDDDASCHYDDDASLLGDFPHHKVELHPGGGIPWDEEDVSFGPRRFKRLYYTKRWRFISAHFTEAAADAYVEQNRHNLKNPRVFVTSQHRCYEWIAAVEHLAEHVPSTEPGGELEQMRKDNAALAACLRTFGDRFLDEDHDLKQIIERAEATT